MPVLYQCFQVTEIQNWLSALQNQASTLNSVHGNRQKFFKDGINQENCKLS